jgi:hypothetical protein
MPNEKISRSEAIGCIAFVSHQYPYLGLSQNGFCS